MKSVNINVKQTLLILAMSVLWLTPACGQNRDGEQDNTNRNPRTEDIGSQQPDALGVDTIANTDEEFMFKMAEGNLAEIELGQLALQKSNSEKVQAYAKLLIEDHTKADKELAQLMKANNISYRAGTFETGQGTELGTTGGTTGSTPLGTETGKSVIEEDEYSPANRNRRSAVDADKAEDDVPMATRLSLDHRAAHDRLRMLSGPRFDTVYLQTMIEDHKKTVQLLENEVRTSGNAQLRDYASRQLPIIREHLQTAQDLYKGVQNAGAAGNNK